MEFLLLLTQHDRNFARGAIVADSLDQSPDDRNQLGDGQLAPQLPQGFDPAAQPPSSRLAR
jgi:phage head maturation protease